LFLLPPLGNDVGRDDDATMMETLLDAAIQRERLETRNTGGHAGLRFLFGVCLFVCLFALREAK